MQISSKTGMADLHVWGCEEATINAADAFLKRSLEEESWLVMLVKAIYL